MIFFIFVCITCVALPDMEIILGIYCIVHGELVMKTKNMHLI